MPPYACGPLESDLIRLWMPDNDLHQETLAEVVDFMVTRGRLTLPGVLLREPDAARPNQVAIAAGGIRLGRLPDEVAAAMAGPVVELKSKGWLAVGSVSFVVSQPDAAGAAGEARPLDAQSAGAAGADAAGTGAAGPGTSAASPRGRIGCRLALPDFARIAPDLIPR